MAAKFVAAIDHGTTSTRCILFDARRHAGRDGAARANHVLPAARLGRARHGARSGSAPRSASTRRSARRARPPADVAGDRDRERARVRRAVGSTDRTPGCALDHMAGHAHRRRRRRARRRRRHPSVPQPDRPADLDVLVRAEAAVAARPRPDPAGGGRAAATCSSARRTPGCCGTSPAVRTAGCTPPIRPTPAAPC